MQPPYRVVMMVNGFMSTQTTPDYEVATQMAHDMLEIAPRPPVFVAVYDSNDVKLWSYELNPPRETGT